MLLDIVQGLLNNAEDSGVLPVVHHGKKGGGQRGRG